MTDRLLLVSTCGTSLLTNGASTEDRVWLTTIANDVDVARLTPIVNARREGLKAADEPTRRKMSAELNGVGAVVERYQPRQVFHLLVCRDRVSQAESPTRASATEHSYPDRFSRLSLPRRPSFPG